MGRDAEASSSKSQDHTPPLEQGCSRGMWLVLAGAGTLFFLASVSWGRVLHVELQGCINGDKNSHVQGVITTCASAVTQPSPAHGQPWPAQHEESSSSHLRHFPASSPLSLLQHPKLKPAGKALEERKAWEGPLESTQSDLFFFLIIICKFWGRGLFFYF